MPGIKPHANKQCAVGKTIVADELRVVIAQVVFHGVVDVVVVICENNIVQLLDDARYFESCGITLEDPLVVDCEYTVGVMNAQGDIAVCRRVDLVVRSFWGIIGGGRYLVLHHRQAPRR